MQLSRISEFEQYQKQSANGALAGDRHRLRWWFYFSLLRMSENPQDPHHHRYFPSRSLRWKLKCAVKKHMAHFKRLFITLQIYNAPNTYPSTLPHKRPRMKPNTPSLKSKHSPWKEATPNPNLPAGWQSTFKCQALHRHLQRQTWSLVTCSNLHNANEIVYTVWIQNKIQNMCEYRISCAMYVRYQFYIYSMCKKTHFKKNFIYCIICIGYIILITVCMQCDPYCVCATWHSIERRTPRMHWLMMYQYSKHSKA